jgi:hypothetical protein
VVGGRVLKRDENVDGGRVLKRGEKVGEEARKWRMNDEG